MRYCHQDTAVTSKSIRVYQILVNGSLGKAQVFYNTRT
jgi:hypothetical protein